MRMRSPLVTPRRASDAAQRFTSSMRRAYGMRVPKKSSAGNAGVRNYVVRSSSDFDVALAYEGEQATKVTVTNLTTGASVASDIVPRATVSVAEPAGKGTTIAIGRVGNACAREG